MDLKAKNHFGLRKPPLSDTVYAINAENNITKKYLVVRDWESGNSSCDRLPPGSINCVAITKIYEQSTQEEITALTDYMQYILISSVTAINPDPNFPSNAYDDIQNPQKRDYVDAFMRDILGLRTLLVNGAWALGINLVVPIRVNYVDGSHGPYMWNLVKQKYEVAPALYRDRFGNMIPITIEELSEGRASTRTTFGFSEADQDAYSFINNSNNLGISVTYGSGSGSASTPIVCNSEWINSKLTVTCKWGS